MTNKELKRMSRTELLQMLLTLVEENERLKSQLEDVTGKLNNMNLKFSKAGSIAEAALQISGVFEDADIAAQQYLQNIKELSDRQNALYRDAEAAAKRKAQAIVAEANAYKAAAIREADEYWNQVRARVRSVAEAQIANSGAGTLPKGNKR